MRASALPHSPSVQLSDFAILAFATDAVTDASVGGGKRLFMLLHGDVMEEMGVREFVERVL